MTEAECNFRFKLLIVFLLILPLLIDGDSSENVAFIEKEPIIGKGTYIKYSIFFERILPNGDQIGIYGFCTIQIIVDLNHSFVLGSFEVIVDLSWVKGRQSANFTQNKYSREMRIVFYEGELIQEILSEFSEGEKYYNPVYIGQDTLYNNSDAFIWSYQAKFENNREVLWNYKRLIVFDYYYLDTGKKIEINASYEGKTGILVYSMSHYEQLSALGEKIRNSLQVSLAATNVPLKGPRDYTPLLMFISFAFIIIIVPSILFVIWLVRKPKRLIQGG
ncbi:MAG: hypothetical protein ACFFAJ_07360 [Candidatus Hodarchaeota archaeon]